MTNPAGLNNRAGVSSKEDSIPKRLAAIEARLREMTAQRNLEAATIGGGGLRSEDFDGTLDPATAGTFGWGLSGSNGNAIFNNIVLRGGIIGNDSLTNPVVPQRLQSYNNIFSITTTFASKLADTLVTPDGFTSVSILAIAHITGVNSRTAAGLLQVRISVNGFPNAPQINEAQPSGYTQVSNSYATELTGLTDGQTIPISVEAAVDAGTWSPITGSDNVVSFAVQAMFFR